MYTFDFNTKEVGTIFDSITHFVLANGWKGQAVAGAKKEDCAVVGDNGQLKVGYPIGLLGKVVLFDLHSLTTGRIMINQCCIKYVTRCYFEIRGEVLYITGEF